MTFLSWRTVHESERIWSNRKEGENESLLETLLTEINRWRYPFNRWASRENQLCYVLADGGYTGDNFACQVKNILEAEVEIAKQNELHTFEVIPKRWIVERSGAWLEKCRRLWKNCERKLETFLQMVTLAFLSCPQNILNRL